MKNSILEKARWLRDVALATSKNNGARVAREWLKYAAMFVMLFTIGIGNVWGETFNTTYGYNDKTSWTLTNCSDKTSYWLCPSGSDPSIATISDIFTGKTITSDVVITINHATYGSGSNPSESTFTIYNSSACSSQVTATKGGKLATSSTYVDVTYTVSLANAAGFSNDLAIKITKPGKQIRLKSINVAFSYTTGVTSYTIYVANNCGDGNSYSVTGAGASTGTYGDWADTYSVSNNTEITLGYTEGSGQTFDGWEDAVLDKSGTSIQVTNNKVTVIKDVYVYCNFSASCTNGTVSYATGSTTHTGGNAINGSHANSTKVCSTNLTLPGVVFTTTGYTQDGWATSDGGSKVYDLSATNYATEGDATLYPHWTANKYTVTWSVNGSTYTTTENVTYNTKTSTPKNPSVPGECTGSTFMGWTENSSWASDSAPGDLFNGTTPTITGNKTFYAVFADEN